MDFFGLNINQVHDLYNGKWKHLSEKWQTLQRNISSCAEMVRPWQSVSFPCGNVCYECPVWPLCAGRMALL